MAKRNAAIVVVDVLPFDAPAGHTEFRRNESDQIVRMAFGCPCGCGRAYGASFDKADRGWTFDGNVEKPTVTPSLGCYPAGDSKVGPDGVYHWHGFLKAGVFEEC